MFKQAPQDNDIRRVMDACLPGLENRPDFEWEVLRQVRGEIKVKKKLTLGIVLTIILLLLSVAALAVALSDVFFRSAGRLQNAKGGLEQWSLEDKIDLINAMRDSGIEISTDKYEVLTDSATRTEEANRLADGILVDSKFAREALEAKYGFTSDTFAFFSKTVSFAEDIDNPSKSIWILSYTPLKYADHIGCYQTQIEAATGRVISTTWTFDEEDTAGIQTDDWSNKVWPIQLVNRIMPFKAEYEAKRALMEQTLGDYGTWSLASKAELDEMLIIAHYPMDDTVLNVLPNETDISEEEAIRIAQERICEKFGISPSVLDDLTQQKSLYQLSSSQEKLWVIEFHSDDADEKYVVEFSSPLGQVSLCAHYIHQEQIPPERVSDTFPAEDKAVEETAIAVAWNAMVNQYGFDNDVREYFHADAVIYADEIHVSFLSSHYNPSKVGTYTFVIDSESNTVKSALWDLENEYAQQGRRSPWKSANLWSSYEYNQYAALRAAVRNIKDRAADEWQLSFEDQAAIDTLYRDAGYDRTEYYHGIPGITDITLENAIDIVKAKIQEVHHVPDDLLSSSYLSYEFDVSDPDLYIWRITVHIDDMDVAFTVEINAQSGEIQQIMKSQNSN